jgi:hypothetical protein
MNTLHKIRCSKQHYSTFESAVKLPRLRIVALKDFVRLSLLQRHSLRRLPNG